MTKNKLNRNVLIFLTLSTLGSLTGMFAIIKYFGGNGFDYFPNTARLPLSVFFLCTFLVLFLLHFLDAYESHKRGTKKMISTLRNFILGIIISITFIFAYRMSINYSYTEGFAEIIIFSIGFIFTIVGLILGSILGYVLKNIQQFYIQKLVYITLALIAIIILSVLFITPLRNGNLNINSVDAVLYENSQHNPYVTVTYMIENIGGADVRDVHINIYEEHDTVKTKKYYENGITISAGDTYFNSVDIPISGSGNFFYNVFAYISSTPNELEEFDDDNNTLRSNSITVDMVDIYEQADLSLEWAGLSVVRPQINLEYALVVKNNGSIKSSPVDIVFDLGNNINPSIEIPALEPQGIYFDTAAPWEDFSVIPESVTVSIDPKNKLPESDKSNNELVIEVSDNEQSRAKHNRYFYIDEDYLRAVAGEPSTVDSDLVFTVLELENNYNLEFEYEMMMRGSIKNNSNTPSSKSILNIANSYFSDSIPLKSLKPFEDINFELAVPPGFFVVKIDPNNNLTNEYSYNNTMYIGY